MNLIYIKKINKIINLDNISYIEMSDDESVGFEINIIFCRSSNREYGDEDKICIDVSGKKEYNKIKNMFLDQCNLKIDLNFKNWQEQQQIEEQKEYNKSIEGIVERKLKEMGIKTTEELE